jgi:hypothetical protein
MSDDLRKTDRSVASTREDSATAVATTTTTTTSKSKKDEMRNDATGITVGDSTHTLADVRPC